MTLEEETQMMNERLNKIRKILQAIYEENTDINDSEQIQELYHAIIAVDEAITHLQKIR